MKLLNKHLKDIGESYFTHAGYALMFFAISFIAAVFFLIHAIFPFIFLYNGSRSIFKLEKILSLRTKLILFRKSKVKRTAIIGFGASGIISFYNLVTKSGQKSLEIDIFEKNILSKGTAYDTKNINHLLNVRSSNMSALEADPEHFVRWLKDNGYQYKKEDFVPRVIYGLYLEDLFSEATKIAAKKEIKYQFYHKRIDKVEKKETAFYINEKFYHSMILCSGAAMKNQENNFWYIDISEFLNDKEIHILGTGLTAFDAVTSLKDKNYQGQIFLHSRTNHLPHSHAKVTPLPQTEIAFGEDLSLAKLVQKFIKECRNAEDWRSVFDSIRKSTPHFWQKMNKKQKSAFVRHCFRYWNIHRHRSEEKQHAKMLALIENKEIILTKARIAKDQKYIDCTGMDFTKKDTLKTCLINSGIAKEDELGLGIISNDNNLTIIGANNFGHLFETTAIPEIRAQGSKLLSN